MRSKEFDSSFIRWAAILAVLPFLGWWLYPVFDLDEGFYAAIVGEMQRRGDWITPHYNGVPWFEKPILLYWAVAPLDALWQSEFMLRLPSVAATLGTAWILYRWIGSAHGQAAGVITGLAYATSLVPVTMGRLMTPDALFVLCMTGAFASFVESLQRRPRRRIVSGAWLGLAVLAKGPVALLLFGGVVIFSFWREKTLRHVFRGGWIAFGVAFVLVVSLWYLPAYLANPQTFVQEFLIEQNIMRFLGGDKSHGTGTTSIWLTPFYYPLVMFLGMMPWSYYALRSYRVVGIDATTRFAVRWCVLVLVFFTLSQSKLPHYILPALPPIAVLAARYLQMVKEAPLNPRVVLRPAILASVGVFLFTQTLFMLWADASGQSEVRAKALALRGRAGSDPIIAYRLTKDTPADFPPGPRPWWKPKVDESSLPSLAYYLDRNILMGDSLAPLAGEDRFFIFTRTNRDLQKDSDLQGEATPILPPDDVYRVFEVRNTK